MKKTKFMLLFLVISLLLAGCGGGSKASAKAVSVAKSAVEVADDYLDGRLSYSQADAKLDQLKEEMAYVDDLKQGDENKASDFSISVSITLLSTDIFHDSVNKTSESYNKVIETRNDLAKAAGLSKR